MKDEVEFVLCIFSNIKTDLLVLHLYNRSKVHM